MFSFYGSKSKIASKYPAPTCDEITEPFAGSAKYALLYWEHNVTIVDIDPKIIGVWKYLQSSNPTEILRLPDVPNATVLESVKGFSQLIKEEKWLIGFCANGGSAQPKNVSGRHNFNSWNRDKLRIARDLHKIKHWRILNASYDEIINRNATWFIDPPYEKQGKYYKFNSIDYLKLGEWCKERLGQIIVCENAGATWLPFEPFVEIAFNNYKTEDDKHRKTKEVVWYNVKEN